MSKIVPHLWYADKAEEAARFYVSWSSSTSKASSAPMREKRPDRRASPAKASDHRAFSRSQVASVILVYAMRRMSRNCPDAWHVGWRAYAPEAASACGFDVGQFG